MLGWLEGSALALWLRESESIWALPTVLTLHTFGMMVLVGASALFDLRLLGVGRRIPLGPLRSLFGVMWIGFTINAVTGTMLFVAAATARGTSAFFFMKLAFVAVGVATMLLLKRKVYAAGADAATVSSATKRLAIVSLVVWTAAVAAGRLLAYVV